MMAVCAETKNEEINVHIYVLLNENTD